MSFATPCESSNLLHGRNRSGSLGEYHDIGMTIVENEEHKPILMHDFSGPLVLEEAALERRDSLVTTLTVLDEEAVVGDVLQEKAGGEATVASEIASMTKGLIGCGALSLSNGIAIASDSPKAALVGIFWIAFFGAVFGYFCWLIGKICEITGHTTYRGIWQETVGRKGSFAVSVANALKAGLANLAYASILSDTMKSLLHSVGITHVPRQVCLLLITVGAILPLCKLKNLHVLAPFSILGTGGMIFTAVALGVRYLDGSYLPGGAYYGDIAGSYQPSFGNNDRSMTTAMLPFVCMCYEAYVMHYNSARFYTELKDRSLPRFGIAVGSSFGLAAILYMAIATFGFLTFGGNSSGYILNNYSTRDPLATICRLAVGLSTLSAYPIVFFGVRDGFLDMFEIPLADQTHENLDRLTYILLSALTVIALFVTDLGLINAVGGGLVASMIVFVFPTIMLFCVGRKNAVDDETNNTTIQNFKPIPQHTLGNDKVLSFGLTILGVIIGVIGAGTAVANAIFSSS